MCYIFLDGCNWGRVRSRVEFSACARAVGGGSGFFLFLDVGQ